MKNAHPKLALAIALLVGVILTLATGLSTAALQAANSIGIQTVNNQLAQVVVNTEKECKPADLGNAVILSKKCTEKPITESVNESKPTKK